MKKRFKVLISLVLVLAMVMGLNATAFAVDKQYITEVEITLTCTPEVGGNIFADTGKACIITSTQGNVGYDGWTMMYVPFDWSVDSMIQAILDGDEEIVEYAINPDDKPKYEAGRYLLFANLLCEDSAGYEFSDDVAVTVDGIEADCVYDLSQLGGDGLLVFKEIDLRTQINTIDISGLPTPKVGDEIPVGNIEGAIVKINGEERNVTVDNTVSYIAPEMEKDFDMSKAGDFSYALPYLYSPDEGKPVYYEEGKLYYFTSLILCGRDEVISDDIKVTINGREASCFEWFGLGIIAYDYGVLKTPTYEFLDNTGEVKAEAGEIKELSFHIDAPLSEFKSLFIGDVELIRNEDYIATEGSTLINFTEKGLAKINAFEPGSYAITAKFNDGNDVALGTMELTKKADDPQVSPKTGDAGAVSMMLVVMLMAAAIGVITYRKREF